MQLYVCGLFSSSSVPSISSSDPNQYSSPASQQTLHTIVGLPHLEDPASNAAQTDLDPDLSSRTWPAAVQPDRVAVVESTAANSDHEDRDASIRFTV